MKFNPLELSGAMLVEGQPVEDERGAFARTWCREEFVRQGLSGSLEQCNLSRNLRKGTLRGMHWQEAPHEETKLVSCLAGSMVDVIVDLRPDSSTFRKWLAVPLAGDDFCAVYIPAGFAHGFVTLEDHTTVSYQMSTGYTPEAVRGFRYDDPSVSIDWGVEVEVISEKDLSYPPLEGLSI